MSSCWYGYLEAGKRSSPVLRDNHLETGNPKTVYMFNLQRGEIIEYSNEIVEKKLRDLKPNEAALIKELDDGYKKARQIFKGRKRRKRNYSDTVNISPYVAAEESDDDVFNYDDSDVWLVSGEA
ncbi:MAG: hypothetical protein OEM43_06580 [Gammaproteobacteria bacterium]|nr:hypothetical protein [Gammaproteobacteria bacterium]